MKKLMITVLFLSYSLLGCSCEHFFISGVIISKSHEAEKQWVQVGNLRKVTLIGINALTTTEKGIPIFYHQKESWSLVIQDSQNAKKQYKVYVPRATYDSVSVGDTYAIKWSDRRTPFTWERAATDEEISQYGF